MFINKKDEIDKKHIYDKIINRDEPLVLAHSESLPTVRHIIKTKKAN